MLKKGMYEKEKIFWALSSFKVNFEPTYKHQIHTSKTRHLGTCASSKSQRRQVSNLTTHRKRNQMHID